FLVRFLENHGFLQVDDRPPWLTVEGGSREYVRAILAGFRGEVRTSAPVATIARDGRGGVAVRALGAAKERFDEVIVAAHADQALRMVADPSPVEREVLGAFPYRRNEVVLHGDDRLMPVRRRAWSSWNYHLDDDGAAGASVTYWMNNLQRLRARRNLFVTLNRSSAVREDAVLERLAYEHPVFTAEGVAAQARHRELVGHRSVSYCGAYWRNGFHEDGVVSALRVCERFGASL
ncbi:MAG TPA: FAD-dependent oxidoreductase, partial [Anaeromyxobacter sp.]